MAQRFLHGLGIGLGLSLHCRPPALPYRNAHVRSAEADRRAPTGAPTAVRAVLCDGQRKASGRDHDMACRVDRAGDGCVGADGRDQVPKPRGAVALLLCARRLGRRAPRARAYAQPHTRDGAVCSALALQCPLPRWPQRYNRSGFCTPVAAAAARGERHRRYRRARARSSAGRRRWLGVGVDRS